jgi:hypothetical protein
MAASNVRPLKDSGGKELIDTLEADVELLCYRCDIRLEDTCTLGRPSGRAALFETRPP